MKDLRLILAVFTLLFCQFSVAGPGGSGGGHTVVTCDKKTVPLDYYRTYLIYKEIRKVDPNQEVLLKDSIKKIRNALTEVVKQYPHLGTSLLGDIDFITWKLSCQPLSFVADQQMNTQADLDYSQGAVQTLGGDVVLDENQITLLGPDNTTILMAHELILFKVGFEVSRQTLAEAVIALVGGVTPDATRFADIMNQFNPNYLNGTYEITVTSRRATDEIKKESGAVIGHFSYVDLKGKRQSEKTNQFYFDMSLIDKNPVVSWWSSSRFYEILVNGAVRESVLASTEDCPRAGGLKNCDAGRIQITKQFLR